ncbi:MAG: D-alanine--D-alanine ligase family protein [Anaerolineae bacterium]
MADKLTVGVIFGSRSVEHDVSIVTAQQVMRALDPARYEVVPVYITREGGWFVGEPLRDIHNFEGDRVSEILGVKEAVLSSNTDFPGLIVPPIAGLVGRNSLRKLDVVFPVVHGAHGEDGTLQGVCEMVDLPYVGCGVMASAIAIDKPMTKAVLSAHGLPVLDGLVVTRQQWVADREAVLDRIEARFSYPVFVKPATLGSSIGIAKVADREMLGNHLDVAANFDQRILIEEALEGVIEVNCAVLGNDEDVRPSVLEQPVSWEEFLTYEEKYMREGGGMKGAERRIPAPISKALTARIQQAAVDAFKAIGGRGTARIDFLVDEAKDEFFVNEVNTMPGSLAFYLWEPEGLSPAHVVDELIRLALEAHAQKRQTRYNYKTGLVAHAAAKGLKGIKGFKK